MFSYFMDEIDDQNDSQPGSEFGEYSGNASASGSVSAHVRNGRFTCSVSETTCSCVSVLFAIWFLVSLTLILGLYGSSHLRLGPNCSFLVKANPIFVEYVKVNQLYDTEHGAMLYGVYEDPPLDILVTSSTSHSVSLPARSEKDWAYFLNQGSEIKISISLKSSSSSSLLLAVAEGTEGLSHQLDDPLHPNTLLARKIIHGNGTFHLSVKKSSDYYVSIANLNSDIVEMQLNFTLRALVYNISKAYYKCSLAHGECSFKTVFPHGNSAVLTTPSPATEQDTSYDDWYIELSYGPRWITYSVGFGGIAVLIFFAFRIMNNCQHSDNVAQNRELVSERAHLLSDKDDDMSSLGSSYDSVSQDDEDVDNEQLKEGIIDTNIRRLCAICFDARRDSFFLPCGHCVACFTCGTRIMEISMTCPICRRNAKKVKKIYVV